MATAGMTKIIIAGQILERPRAILEKISPNFLGELLQCYACTGFWSGIFCGILLMEFNISTIFACGCAGSFVCTFTEYLLRLIDAGEMLCKIMLEKVNLDLPVIGDAEITTEKQKSLDNG